MSLEQPYPNKPGKHAHMHTELLLTHAIAHAPEEARKLVGVDTLRTHLGDALHKDLAWCDDMDFARGFAQHCPVQGVTPEAYLHRLIEVQGHTVLAGVRFKGGNLEHPFVDLLASTIPDGDALFGTMLNAIMKEFAAFTPRHIRMLSGPTLAAHSWRAQWAATIDQYIVAGKVRDIAQSEVQGDVSLKEVERLDESLDFLQAGYAQAFEHDPGLDGVVFPASKQDFEACQDTGSLMWIMRGEDQCGLLATYEHSGSLCAGACIMEELVIPAHRGKSLASQGQSLLAEHIATHKPDALLWGTIDASNKASLRAAQRAGRHPIAAWHWLAQR